LDATTVLFAFYFNLLFFLSHFDHVGNIWVMRKVRKALSLICG